MPVTVTVKIPALPLLQLRVEVPEPVTLVGLRVQARPAGETAAVSETVPVKPLTGAIVIVEVPVAPAFTVTLFGDAVIVKSTGGVTTFVTVVE